MKASQKKEIRYSKKLGFTLEDFELIKNAGFRSGINTSVSEACLQLIIVLEGVYILEINGQVFELRPQTGVLFQCNSTLHISIKERSIGSFYSLKLNIIESKNSLIASYLSAKDGILKPFFAKEKPYLIFDEEAGKDILQLSKIVHQESKSELIGNELIIEAAIMAIFGKLIRVNSHIANFEKLPKKLNGEFINLVETINQKIDYKWTVGEMAAIVGMSHTRFHEQSKIQTGYSPIHLLMVLRIERAKEMLIKSDQSITEIAFSTGFVSSQHFATTFQKLAKNTPRNYRKRHKLLPNQNYLSG